MKKLFIILICLLIGSPVFAANTYSGATFQGAVVGGGTEAGCTPSYVFTENADCSSGCAANCSGTDGLANCFNTWTPSGTVTFTGNALEGSNSIRVDETGGVGSAYLAFTAADNAYVHLIFTISANPSTSKLISGLRTTSTERGKLQITSTGQLRIYHGTVYGTTAGTMTAGTAYHIWYSYEKDPGGGAGKAYAMFSDTSTKPDTSTCAGLHNNCVYISTGDGATTVNRLYLAAGTTAKVLTFDHIGVSTAGGDICSPTP
jgi:hypothetical protein